MAYDRNSAVSSFYGDRRSSYDALNATSPTAAATGNPSARARHDSSSSFFNPNAAALPQGARGPIHTPSAGYNRASFFDAGREEPLKDAFDAGAAGNGAEGARGADEWDVYADFNNAGPRYSSAFGMKGNEASYQPIHSPQVSYKHEDPPSTSGPVELVTVPALGAEWKASELRDMTSRGQREHRSEAFSTFWRGFTRGDQGLFGRKWLNRRFIVFFCFGFIALIVILLVVLIPRVPDFLFNVNQPLKAATGSWNNSIPVQFSVIPANFTFPAEIDLQVDTGSNNIPLTFTRLDGTVFDLETLRQVGVGHINRTTVPAKKFTTLTMPLNFTYTAINNSDPVWSSWHASCENRAIAVNGTRPGLSFRLVIEMGISGLPGVHSTSTSITNAPCPVELPSTAA